MFYRHGKKVGFNSKYIFIYLRALNRRVTWSDLPCRFVGGFFLVVFFFFLVYHLILLLGDRVQEWGEEGNRISIRGHYLVGQKRPGPEASSGDANETVDSGCSWDLELVTADPDLLSTRDRFHGIQFFH